MLGQGFKVVGSQPTKASAGKELFATVNLFRNTANIGQYLFQGVDKNVKQIES